MGDKKDLKRGLGRLGKLSLAMVVTLVANGQELPSFADDILGSGDGGSANDPIIQNADADVVSNIEVKTVADFKDVSPSHWAVPSMNWGLSQGLMSGYPDRTFKPDTQLTEAEFAVIFEKYANNTAKDIKGVIGEHWSQGFYDELMKWELPFRGYKNNYIKDTAVTRGQIAMIVAAKYGFNLTEKQAVYFMYENGLSVGLETGKRTYESYGAEKPLTRAQAITFMKNIDNMGTKVMTFNGKTSTVKNAGYKELVGVVGVNVDNTISTNFSNFDSIADAELAKAQADAAAKLAEQQTQTTTVVTPVKDSGSPLLTSTKDYKFAYKDGKVYVSEFTRFGEVSEQTGGLLRWEYGPKDPLGKDKYYNVFDVDSNIKSGAIALPNSIVIYNGVELPLGDMFEIEDSMKSYNEGTGIVQTSLDYSSLGDKDNGGAFQDPVAFKVLIQNFKQFGATDEMIQAIWDNTDKWYGKSSKEIIGDYIDTSYYYHSKINNVTLHVHVGDGGVSVTLHKGYDYARQFKTTDYEINEHINIK